MTRIDDLGRLYELLARLSHRVGGPRQLSDLGNYRDWPERGVYFFFEPGERRGEADGGLRVVRVGTHALKAGSKSTLRQRLGQHRGQISGCGNHRGSIFRLLVGQALLEREATGECRTWGVKGTAALAAAHLGMSRQEVLDLETSLEQRVSNYICAMPFLWLDVGDPPGPDSLRATIERNSIALLSNHDRTPLDPATHNWLGRASNRDRVRVSGLWNQNHVEELHDPAFLDILEERIADIGQRQ